MVHKVVFEGFPGLDALKGKKGRGWVEKVEMMQKRIKTAKPTTKTHTKKNSRKKKAATTHCSIPICTSDQHFGWLAALLGSLSVVDGRVRKPLESQHFFHVLCEPRAELVFNLGFDQEVHFIDDALGRLSIVIIKWGRYDGWYASKEREKQKEAHTVQSTPHSSNLPFRSFVLFYNFICFKLNLWELDVSDGLSTGWIPFKKHCGGHDQSWRGQEVEGEGRQWWKGNQETAITIDLERERKMGAITWPLCDMKLFSNLFLLVSPNLVEINVPAPGSSLHILHEK